MIALYAGSFAPPTKGHLDIIRRASAMFEKVYVAVMINPEKKYIYPVEARLEMLAKITAGIGNVECFSSSGMTVDEARRVGADVLVRGVRTGGDFDSEMQLASANRILTGIDTVFLPCSDLYSGISSTIVNDIAKHNGPIDAFVPAEIINDILERVNAQA